MESETGPLGAFDAGAFLRSQEDRDSRYGFAYHQIEDLGHGKEFWRDDVAYINLKRFGAHTTPEGRLYVQRCLSRFCWRTRHEGIAMDCNRPSCWKHRRGTGTGGSRLYFCLTFRGKVRLFIPVTKENGFKGWTMKDGEGGGKSSWNATSWKILIEDHILPLSGAEGWQGRCQQAWPPARPGAGQRAAGPPLRPPPPREGPPGRTQLRVGYPSEPSPTGALVEVL